MSSITANLQVAISKRPRHPDLWFDDGSVVFATRDMLFCVYRGTLSKRSPVFRDMFSLPQPARNPNNEDEFLEGIPTVAVSDDAMDLALFFAAIYLKSSFSDRINSTAREVSAVLRLSVKYQMNDLRNDIIQFLRPFFPTSLEEWHQYDTMIKEDPFQETEDICRFMRLFREIDLQAFRPANFLWASWCDIEELIPNESVTPGNDEEDTLFLSQNDLLVLLVGRQKLFQTMQKSLFALTITMADKFKGRKSCTCHRQILRSPFSEAWRGNLHDSDLMRCLDDDSLWFDGLCSACGPEAAEGLLSLRREIWEQIPSFFNLAPWETLRQHLRSTLSEEVDI